MDLSGRVAIVTGSGRGLGLAYAKALAAAGASVVVNDVDPAVVDAAVAEIPGSIGVAAAVGDTGQAIGIGGDRLALWAHPREKAVAFADGGWTASAIAGQWSSGVGADPETYGFPAPKAPAA